MKSVRNILGVSALLLAVVVMASSCKKNKDATGVVKVLKDSVNFVTGDTVQVPAVLATVRFYLDKVVAEHIDTNIFTGTDGKATFVWFEDAIIQYDVQLGNFTDVENYIILEQGETVEKTVIVE